MNAQVKSQKVTHQSKEGDWLVLELLLTYKAGRAPPTAQVVSVR